MGDRGVFLLLFVVWLAGCTAPESHSPIPTPTTLVRLHLRFELDAPATSQVAVSQEISSGQGSAELSLVNQSGLSDANQAEPCAEAVRLGFVSRATPFHEPVRGYFQSGSDSSLAEQGHLSLLQAEKLWTTSRGNGVTVAVIDSGVDPREPSLQGALLPGYDFLLDSPCMRDDSGHGTAIASLIAGRGPDWGIAPEVRILPLRVLNQDREGSSYHVTRAVLFAANLLADMPNPYPAQVINLSLGAETISRDLYEAIDRVRQQGVLVVAAAGNDSLGVAAFPAAMPAVLAVGAAEVIHGRWRLTPYSNAVDEEGLLAPMGGLTDTNWGRYAEAGVWVKGQRLHGTSFAAAQISGLAALMLSLLPDADRVWEYLVSSASRHGANHHRLVNPVAALTALSTTTLQPIVVQFLDAGSFQEVLRFQADTELDTLIPPGRYYVQVWLDENKDGLWQESEAGVRIPEMLDLQPGQVVTRYLRLAGCC